MQHSGASPGRRRSARASRARRARRSGCRELRATPSRNRRLAGSRGVVADESFRRAWSTPTPARGCVARAGEESRDEDVGWRPEAASLPAPRRSPRDRRRASHSMGSSGLTGIVLRDGAVRSHHRRGYRRARVQSGLEGVVAFATEIAEPDKEGSALRYRGVDIEDLVGAVPFEQVWGLLVDGAFLPGLPCRALAAARAFRPPARGRPGGARHAGAGVGPARADRHHR